MFQMRPFFILALWHRRDYKSEYRQRFRPFSQYEYLDGRFIPSPGAQSPPTATHNVSHQHQSHHHRSRQQLQMQQKATSLHGEPWYREVVELRRQANDYKVGLSIQTFTYFYGAWRRRGDANLFCIFTTCTTTTRRLSSIFLLFLDLTFM